MGLPIIGDIIDTVGGLVSEVVVDVDKKKELEFKLQELRDQADQRFHEELMGQIEINKVEAASTSVFVAGWRPFIGWIGGVGLGWTFVLSPFVEYVSRLFGWKGLMPEVDTASLMTLVLGMLGVGAMRSYEKTRGVPTAQIND